MENRFIVVLLLVIRVSVLNAQPYKENGGTVFNDLIDTSKVFKILERDKDGDNLDVYYYNIKDTADVSVRFKGGNDCLVQYFDSCYYVHIDSDRMAYKEFNAHVAYSLLFDSNLHIKDVRMLDIYPHSYLLKPYHEWIKDILLSTERKWYKENNKRKWSVYIFVIHIRLLPDE